MEPNELVRRRDDVLIVDVREDFEWDAGHIPGAVHVPLGQLSDELDRIDGNRAVVTVCRTGPRSERAAQTLRSSGLLADHLEGGVAAWHGSGQALVDRHGFAGAVVSSDPNEHEDHEAGREAEDPELESFQDDFLAIAMALNERFGDREPTDQEAKAFMREWLQKKGTPEAEIDRILAE